MNVKAYLNNQPVNINNGFTIKEVLSEELNTGLISVSWIPESFEIKQFDDVVINIDNEYFYFIVADFNKEEAIREEKLYNASINLISETFKLQKNPMPNLSITHSLVGDKRNIYYYLNNYHELYIKNKYSELVISDELKALTENIVVAENQWNEPTAYEVFNTLISPTNSIITIKNHQISYLDLTKKGNPIDESKIFYTNKGKTINDYVSEIQVEAQNALTPSVNTITPRGLTARNINQAGITTDDLKIVLDKPIEKITYAECYATLKTNNGNKTFTFILTDRIVEESIYNTLKLSNSVAYEPSKNYKRSNLYYAQGGKEISGLSFSEKNIFGLGNTPMAIQNILISKYNNAYPTNLATEVVTDLRDIGFYIEYIAIDNAKFVVRKENHTYAGIIDHQTESYIDADQFAKAEELTINRLGNEVKEITGQYSTISECPNLGDYIGDYILMTRELNVYQDIILFKGILSKDYVNRDLFYGVNSKKRNTQIATGDQALLRTDYDSYTATLSFGNSNNSNYKKMEQYLLHGLMLLDVNELDSIYSYLEPLNIKMVAIRSTFLSGQVTTMLAVTPAAYKVGKQAILTFRAYDNFSVGMYVNDPTQTGGYGQEYASYVDGNGEFSYLDYYLFESLRPYYKTHPEYANYNITDDERIKISRQFPIVKYDGAVEYKRECLNGTKKINKDNREITALSIAFNFTSDDKDNIIVTDEFVKTCPILEFTYKKASGFIYMSTTEKYYKNDTKVKGELVIDSYEIDWSYYSQWLLNGRLDSDLTNFIKLYKKKSATLNLEDVQSWAIGDNNGNIYIAVNKRNGDQIISDTIYLNLTKDNL